MSGLKYNDFPSGTYDTSKIFLQADATTGALEKINLPATSAGYCKFSKSLLINANNTGANPQTLGTILIPANTLDTDGDWLEVNLLYRYITTTGTKEVEISSPLFGGFSTPSTAGNNYDLVLSFMRVDATHIVGYFRATTITLSIPFTNIATTTCDFTINNAITVKVLQGIANDIFLAYAAIKVFKA